MVTSCRSSPVITCDDSYSNKWQLSNISEQQTLYKVGKIQANDEQSNSGVIDAFIDAIQNNKAPLNSGEDGYKSLQIVLAAVQSSKTSKRVRI